MGSGMYRNFGISERNGLRIASEYESDDAKPDWKHNMNGQNLYVEGVLRLI